MTVANYRLRRFCQLTATDDQHVCLSYLFLQYRTEPVQVLVSDNSLLTGAPGIVYMRSYWELNFII